MRGEIEAPRQAEAQARDRGGAEKQGVDLRNVSRAEDPTASRHDGQTLQGREEERLDLATEQPAKKRGMFAGLKLDSGRR